MPTEQAEQPTRGYKITDSRRVRTNLAVTFDVLEGGEKVETLAHAFPLDMEQDQVEEGIKQVVRVFFEDRETAVANAATDKSNTDADARAEELTGKEGTV